ncbi:histidinol dehydrogenase [Pseudoramibacter sp.]|jgi:histidinol dehydrogenase|uniref:histidinol dehydrogenase n=1 Tax=Pseudoramibacter sp. TaxID=2034862 RepID=UPI0025E563BB|nr:histidinol dehydrogenase [Pseudoramibacter sp.]MCH4071466.1 histidinol dehydrogenase [Pseudoramibacter sp.]MCH4105234.1 histidinol dehydrogenase [Pseudoramibacter sp.]
MKKYIYNETVRNQLDVILKRSEADHQDVRATVLDIIDNVKANGDQALIDYEAKFDRCQLDSLKVTPEEIDRAFEETDPELIATIRRSAENIRRFHEHQKETTWTINPKPGITLGQHITPISRVGVYVPGGKAAYPSTVLMDTIPAIVAGVHTIAMVTPPDASGQINSNILCAAKIAGVTEIYKVGGAQAIAALAYGTETIAPVNKIVGPGNIFVATAKKEVFGKVAIDMIAGPSEVCVIADSTANPVYIAADLLSQAEHDEMAMPVLVTPDEALADKIIAEIDRQIEADLRRKAIAKASVTDHGFAFICKDLDEAFELTNQIAPEHLELAVENAENYLDRVQNAGAIFLGMYSPEPLGDYYAGPNHTLPTSGTAKFSSPLGVYDFIKRSSIIQYDRANLKAAAHDITAFAYAEGLDAHAKSIERRFPDEN